MMSGNGDQCLGSISKPHGLNGDLKVIITPGSENKIEEGIPLFIDIDGQRIPFFVEEFEAITEDQLIIKLEFIGTKTEADRLTGCKVYSDDSEGGQEEGVELFNLAGYLAVDEQKNFRGRVVDLVEQNENRLLLIDFSGEEIMVPYVPELICEVNHMEKTIYLDLPEGLIQINRK